MLVRRLMLIRTGRFHDQVQRPYQIHTDPSLQHQLVETTHHGAKLEVSNLAGIAGQIMRPTAVGIGGIAIPGGWAEPRMRFLLEVEHPDMQGNNTIQYISGYTDYVGMGQMDTMGQAALDPNMKFFINTSINTRNVVTANPYGVTQSLRTNMANHVINAASPTGLDTFQQAMQTQRPEDVVGTITTNHDEYADFSLNLGSSFGNAGGVNASHLKLSNRSHGSAPRYMSRLFKGYQAGMQMSSSGADMMELNNNVIENIRDELPSSDRFIGNLVRHGMSLAENTWFSLRELYDLCPDAVHTTKIVEERQVQHVPDYRNMSGGLADVTQETIIATMLSNALPALMTDSLMTEVAFVVNNRNLDGSSSFVPLGANSFTGGAQQQINLRQHMNQFEARFMNEVWRDLTRHGVLDLELRVQFSLLGTSTVTVQFQANPAETFHLPTFSDALFTPVLAAGYQQVKHMAQEVDTLNNILQTDLSPNAYRPEEPKIISSVSAGMGASLANQPMTPPGNIII